MDKKKENAIIVASNGVAITKCSCSSQVMMKKENESQHKGTCSKCGHVLIYISKDRKLYEFLK